MNDEANTIHWRPGDLVLHDADAKRAEMLMQVIGYDEKTGKCKTRYVNPAEFGFPTRRVYRNWIEVLHDPRRFGVEAPNPVESDEQP